MIKINETDYFLCKVGQLKDSVDYLGFIKRSKDRGVIGDIDSYNSVLFTSARLAYDKDQKAMCIVARVSVRVGSKNQLKTIENLGEGSFNFVPVIVSNQLATFDLIKGE